MEKVSCCRKSSYGIESVEGCSWGFGGLERSLEELVLALHDRQCSIPQDGRLRHGRHTIATLAETRAMDTEEAQHIRLLCSPFVLALLKYAESLCWCSILLFVVAGFRTSASAAGGDG